MITNRVIFISNPTHLSPCQVQREIHQGGSDHGRRAVLQRVRQLQLHQLPQLAWGACPAQGNNYYDPG